MPKTPYLIQFDQIGNPAEGYIASTQHASKLPFEVRRVFWTYDTPSKARRGRHANNTTEEVLVAIRGSITVEAEWEGSKQNFILDSPAIGLYIPAMCWTCLTFSEGAIAVCLASTDFSNDDYIRDYKTFLHLTAKER